MKILVIINSMTIGGAEKLVVDTARCMAALDNSVDIFILSPQKTHLLSKLREISNVRVLYINRYYNLYNPLWIFKIRTLLLRNHYDSVHVHLFPSLYWAGLAQMLSFRKQPIVYTEHNTTNRRRRLNIFKIPDRFIYRQYNSVITISDSVHVNLKRHLGNASVELIKIYNGINLDEISQCEPYSKRALHLDERDQIIIQVSSFTLQKNQSNLIKCLQLLPKQFHLFLVGNGPTKDEMIALVKTLHLMDRVHFLGIRNDVPKLLKTADFVVLSSHFEGLSLSSVEGLASGKPFIATDVPGLTEVVQNAGILVPNNNPEALAETVKMLAINEVAYSETANRGLKRSKKYDINQMVNKYLALYDSLNLKPNLSSQKVQNSQ